MSKEVKKIRHKEHGEVDGVTRRGDEVTYWNNTVAWTKNGAVYYRLDGWEEVPKTRLVDVTGDIIIQSRTGSSYFGLEAKVAFTCLHPFSIKKVDRYDLPPLDEVIFNLTDIITLLSRPDHEIRKYLQQFQKPCLVIQKEEPCP